jgi:thiol-disulfide isomerase/thioredoxin
MTNAKKAKAARRAAPPKKTQKRSTNLWIGIAAGVFAVIIIAVIATSGGGAEATEPAAAGAVSVDRDPGPTLAVGESIPDWSAPSLDGDGVVAWSDYAGTPTVLTIWAPWCPHCQAELPRLNEAMANHPDVELVTITTMVERGSVGSKDWLDSQGLEFTTGVDDADLTLMQALGVEGTPTTYFVNADGTVYDVRSGEIGLQEDGSIDPAELDAILGGLEAQNAG